MKRFVVQVMRIKTELMLAEQAVLACLVAFGVWMPSEGQAAALFGAQAAILAVLVGWYRR